MCFVVHTASLPRKNSTEDVIQQRALLYKQELLDSASTEVYQEARISFTASIGRMLNFFKRHDIDFVSLHGQKR